MLVNGILALGSPSWKYDGYQTYSLFLVWESYTGKIAYFKIVPGCNYFISNFGDKEMPSHLPYPD